MKVIGIAIKKGEYQGRPYHNAVFYCVGDLLNGNAVGQSVEQIKVNYATLLRQIGTDKTDKDIHGYLGKDLEFAYNKFGSVEYITEFPEVKAAK